MERSTTYLVDVIPPVSHNFFVEGMKVDLLPFDVQQLSVEDQPLGRAKISKRPVEPLNVQWGNRESAIRCVYQNVGRRDRQRGPRTARKVLRVSRASGYRGTPPTATRLLRMVFAKGEWPDNRNGDPRIR